MNIIPVHTHLIMRLLTANHSALPASLTPTEPIALCLLDSPSIANPAGFAMVMSPCESVISAVSLMMQTLATQSVPLAGWAGPITHAFVFEWRSFTELSVAAWSSTGDCSTGLVTKPPHPEFPPAINLLPAPQSAIRIANPLFHLQLLQHLVASDPSSYSSKDN